MRAYSRHLVPGYLLSVPTGRHLCGGLFQALRARLPSSCPYGTKAFSNLSQAVNCQATIVQSGTKTLDPYVDAYGQAQPQLLSGAPIPGLGTFTAFAPFRSAPAPSPRFFRKTDRLSLAALVNYSSFREPLIDWCFSFR